MADPLDEDREKKKRAIFDSMAPKRQQKILKKVGFENWDPFQEPKDPIDIRKDKTKRTTQELFRAFLQSRNAEEYSNAYGSGVFEMCHGIINDDDKYIGMFEFSVWYQELLKQEGHK